MDLAELERELDAMGTKGFVDRHGRLFLVLSDEESLDDVADFVNTQTRAGHEIAGRRKKALDLRPIHQRRGRSGGKILIGRDAECDIVINHRLVSKQHAYFVPVGGLLSLADAKSKNGTFLNGSQLQPDRGSPVEVGDKLEFGPVMGTVWSLDDVLAAIAAR